MESLTLKNHEVAVEIMEENIKCSLVFIVRVFHMLYSINADIFRVCCIFITVSIVSSITLPAYFSSLTYLVPVPGHVGSVWLNRGYSSVYCATKDALYT